MNKKKLGSILLSLVLAVTILSDSMMISMQSKAQTVEKIIVFVAAQGQDAEGKNVLLPKTVVQIDKDATAETAIKQALDQSQYKDNYKISSNAWGDSLDAIGELSQTEDYSAYWSFCINNAWATEGIGSCKLQSGDKISLIYANAETTATQCSTYEDDALKNPDEAAQNQLLTEAKQQQKVLAAKIFETQFKNGKYVPGIEDANSLYSVFSLAQAGYQNDAFYDDVYEKIANQFAVIQKNGKIYDAASNTEISFDSIMNSKYASQTYAKIALCVSALGKDITNVGGVNLLDKLVSKSVYDKSSIFSRESMILFAIDAKNSILPTGENYLTRAELITKLQNDVDNQIAQSVLWNSMDSAAMSVQALAAYRNQEIEGIDTLAVNETYGKVLSILSGIQAANGGYADNYSQNNAWTLAQAMTTVGLYGINPLMEEKSDFIKNGATFFNASAAFVDSKKETVDGNLMAFQPEQLLRGLNACIRAIESKENLYSTTSVEYTAKNSSKIAISFAKASAISTQKYTGKAVTPAITLTYDGKKLQKGTDYKAVYKNNVKAGIATIVISGTGNYILDRKITFKIEKKAAEKKLTLKKPVITKMNATKKKTITVSFGKVANAKKYVVEISKYKNFKKSIKKTTSQTKVKYTKLSSKKKYYIRVRAYNGTTKSAYSTVKTKKIK